MKTNPLIYLSSFLISSAAVAQQTNFVSSVTNNETIAKLRAKAESGDAQTQYELGVALNFGKSGTWEELCRGSEVVS